jgi:hypothetical protein
VENGWSWIINYAVKFWHREPCNYGNQLSHSKIHLTSWSSVKK